MECILETCRLKKLVVYICEENKTRPYNIIESLSFCLSRAIGRSDLVTSLWSNQVYTDCIFLAYSGSIPEGVNNTSDILILIHNTSDLVYDNLS